MNNSIKNIILWSIIIALTFPACVMVDPGTGYGSKHDQGGIVGSGKMIIIGFGFRDFTRIFFGHVFRATIRKSTTYSVKVEMDDNIKPYVQVHQSGNLLSIDLDDNTYSDITVNVTIETPDVSSIEAAGAGSVHLDGMYLDHDIQLTGSGSTVFNGTLTARTVTMNLQGSSTVELTGSADDLSAYGTGATQLALLNFPVKRCTVVMTGGSVSNVWASETLEVTLNGGAVLRYKGNPSTRIVDVAGGSFIQRVS
jgi:hypothetical protein